MKKPRKDLSRAVRFQEDVVSVKELDFGDLEKVQTAEFNKPSAAADAQTVPGDVNALDTAIYNYLRKMNAPVSELANKFKVRFFVLLMFFASGFIKRVLS